MIILALQLNSRESGLSTIQVQCFHQFKPMDRPPVHELSAVNGHSLRFKYRATPGSVDPLFAGRAGAKSAFRFAHLSGPRPYALPSFIWPDRDGKDPHRAKVSAREPIEL